MATIYTDGGSRMNGQPGNIGAWAFAVWDNATDEPRYHESRAEKNTTNNIQEMKALINALKWAENKVDEVIVYSDSSYLINGFDGWMHNWHRNGWKRGKNLSEDVKNKELWQELLSLKYSFMNVGLRKVKGHSGDKGNEFVDGLVNKAMDEATISH